MGRKNRRNKNRKKPKAFHNQQNSKHNKKKKSYVLANVELSDTFIEDTIGTQSRYWSMNQNAVHSNS